MSWSKVSTKNKNKSVQRGPKESHFLHILHCMGQGMHAFRQAYIPGIILPTESFVPFFCLLVPPPLLPAPTRCPDRFMHFLPERLDHYFFKINFKFYIQSTKNKNKSAQCGPKMCSFRCILHCMDQGTHALGQGCVQRGEKRGTTLC